MATTLFGAIMCAALAAGGAAPLQVGEDGAVLKDGRPYRGVGVNYFSAFSRTIEDPEDTSYREGFAVLCAHNVPFIRFMACGFYPSNWKLYREDRTEYFRRFDRFVKDAEEAGLGLIPSLFWFDACVPDLVGEPRSAWGEPSSKTHAFMCAYVAEVVGRYVDSPAIWAWELGNEYNLAADLPNAAQHRPPIVPHWGSPTERSAADDMTHAMIVTASRAFAQAVRAHDAVRPVTTGHSIPRAAQHHLRAEGVWRDDAPAQFEAILLELAPDPIDLVSVHMYAQARKRFGRDDVAYAELLEVCRGAAAKAGKALFLGEFGASHAADAGGVGQGKATVLAMLEAVEASAIPLAAFWVYDLPQQTGSYNVTPEENAYVLDALEAVNTRLRALQ